MDRRGHKGSSDNLGNGISPKAISKGYQEQAILSFLSCVTGDKVEARVPQEAKRNNCVTAIVHRLKVRNHQIRLTIANL